MTALEESSDRCKDSLRPIFKLGPWFASKLLQNSFDRLEEVYPRRAAFLLYPEVSVCDGPREVHSELARLRDPNDGYRNWYELLASREQFIPSLQIEHIDGLAYQAERLAGLSRGLLIPFSRKSNFRQASSVCALIAPSIKHRSDVSVLLDMDVVEDHDIISHAASIVDLIGQIRAQLPLAEFIVSGSSFPRSFEKLENLNISEKLIFQEVVKKIGSQKLAYSDRGGVSAKRAAGGATVTYARVDLAMFRRWRFYRSKVSGAEPEHYAEQARLALADRSWDPLLQIWATQMIGRCAAGDETSIKSPVSATAVRINMHLHKQAFGSKRNPGYYDTDDEWSD